MQHYARVLSFESTPDVSDKEYSQATVPLHDAHGERHDTLGTAFQPDGKFVGDVSVLSLPFPAMQPVLCHDVLQRYNALSR